jgi:hypothetical protein
VNEEVNQNRKGRSLAKPLPSTLEDWQKARQVTIERTLNDNVETLHLGIIAHQDRAVAEKYNDFLDAVFPEDAREGSLVADDHEAARMVREYASEVIGDGGAMRDSYVASKNLATIVKALRVVLRRYKSSREQRAAMIDGHEVPNDVV